MIWFFIFLAVFFVVFLYALLRKPAESGETFLSLFAFWNWFEEYSETGPNVKLTSLWTNRWFGVDCSAMKSPVFKVQYWVAELILFRRSFRLMVSRPYVR